MKRRNLVLETSTTAGTDPLVLLGAFPGGYVSWASQYATDETFRYVARQAFTGLNEVGLGHLDGSGHLNRDAIESNSEGTTDPVNFGHLPILVANVVSAGDVVAIEAAVAAAQSDITAAQAAILACALLDLTNVSDLTLVTRLSALGFNNNPLTAAAGLFFKTGGLSSEYVAQFGFYNSTLSQIFGALKITRFLEIDLKLAVNAVADLVLKLSATESPIITGRWTTAVDGTTGNQTTVYAIRNASGVQAIASPAIVRYRTRGPMGDDFVHSKSAGEPDPPTVMFDADGPFEVRIGFGESTWAGADAHAEPVDPQLTFTQTPPAPYHVLTTDRGVNWELYTRAGANQNRIDTSTILAFAPCFEQIVNAPIVINDHGETPNSQWGYKLHRDRLRDGLPLANFLMFGAAHGGYNTGDNAPGSDPYINAKTWLQRVVDLARTRYGRGCRPAFCSFNTGINDALDLIPAATVKTQIQTMLSSWRTDAGAILTTANDSYHLFDPAGLTIRMLLAQESTGILLTDPDGSNIAQIQNELCGIGTTPSDDFIMPCPQYFLGHVDTLHRLKIFNALVGEYHGQAEHEFTYNGGFSPTQIFEVDRSGTALTITIATPFGDRIAIDPLEGREYTGLAQYANYGFACEGPTLSNVSQIASNQLRGTLSAATAGNLDYAWLNSIAFDNKGDPASAGGNIRDRSTKISKVTGNPLYNYLVRQRVPFS